MSIISLLSVFHSKEIYLEIPGEKHSSMTFFMIIEKVLLQLNTKQYIRFVARE